MGDRSTNGRIPKVKKVTTGKKLKADITPLRSHAAGKLDAPRKKMSDGEQSANLERVARERGTNSEEAPISDTPQKLAGPKAQTA